MPNPDAFRRQLLQATWGLPVLASLHACKAPLRELSRPATAEAARTVLDESAAAHGAKALAQVNDISVRYVGRWRAVVGKLQPTLIDSGFRGVSEERLLFPDLLVSQSHVGPSGRKHVTRRAAGGRDDAHVWFNGEETKDPERLAAAALVVDGYSVFLLGPMILAGPWAAERQLAMELGGVERLTRDARRYDCDVVNVRVSPGLGFSNADQLALYIDRDERLLRRMRFTLNGLESTRGAVADVDLDDYMVRFGIAWPTRFYERLLRPLPLPVHNWTLDGLDINRGLQSVDLMTAEFKGSAAVPAATLR